MKADNQNLENKKIIFVLLAVILFGDIFKINAFSNSAKRNWYGVDMTGAIVKDKECPLEVEEEELTFDISEFPDTYYDNEAKFLAYSGKVTAKYTFYNPKDYKVTAKLVFPFGNYPDYGCYKYSHENNTSSFADDIYKYGVKVNDKEIKSVLRHTFSTEGSKFNLENDMSLLHDGFVKDDFYSPDLTVTKYTYEVSGIDEGKYPYASEAVDIPVFDGKRKFWLQDGSGYDRKEDESSLLSLRAKNGEEVILYVIGEPVTDDLKWNLYKDGGNKIGEEIDGKLTLKNTEELSFKEFTLAEYDEKSNIMESDWYNVMVYLFNRNGMENSSAILPDIYNSSERLRFLLRWYEYEITLNPGEKIVNTVEAPMYPSIDLRYEPGIYEYTYLLSPASTWAKFGELNIDINTQFNMLENNQEGFDKTSSGYNFKSDGLPEGELKFSLSESEKPEKKDKGTIWFVVGFLVLGLLQIIGYILFGVVVIILLIVVVKKFIGKKKE